MFPLTTFVRAIYQSGHATRRAGVAALDYILPAGCMRCDRPVAGTGQLCGACFGACHFISAPLCRRCGVPFGFVAEGGVAQLCPSCIDRPPGFARARAALAYDDASKSLILPFKHAGRPEVARLLAPMMARSGALLLADATLLIPVPLHRRRLRERGYNQAGQLALALSRSTGLPWLPDALERRKQTEALGGQGLAARTETMRGAISVQARHIARMAGERVILIDDVMTSGATASACADVLLAAGSTRVDVLVAARVPDPMLNAGAPRPRRVLT